jgi:hypothetical protein
LEYEVNNQADFNALTSTGVTVGLPNQNQQSPLNSPTTVQTWMLEVTANPDQSAPAYDPANGQGANHLYIMVCSQVLSTPNFDGATQANGGRWARIGYTMYDYYADQGQYALSDANEPITWSDWVQLASYGTGPG